LHVTNELLRVFPRVGQNVDLERPTEGVSDDAAGDNIRETDNFVLDRLDVDTRDLLVRHRPLSRIPPLRNGRIRNVVLRPADGGELLQGRERLAWAKGVHETGVIAVA
jgi:hypothetical protein